MERQNAFDLSWLAGGAVVVTLGALLMAESAVQSATTTTIFGSQVNPLFAVVMGFTVAILGGIVIGEAARSRRSVTGFPSDMGLVVINALAGGVLIGIGGVLSAIIPQIVFNAMFEAALFISGVALFVLAFVRARRLVV